VVISKKNGNNHIQPSANDDFPQEVNENGGLLSGVPVQKIASVEQLEKLVNSVMSTSNMNLRSNIKPQLLVHLVRMQIFAEHYDSPRMREAIKFILETHVSVKGWGMGNLISALQATRPSFMGDDMHNGIGSRVRGMFGGRR
jgi:hypothetical protein